MYSFSSPTMRELNEYIYFRDNVWGVHREWWFCRVCEEWFLAERHTYTNEVLRTWHPEAVGSAGPDASEAASMQEGAQVL